MYGSPPCGEILLDHTNAVLAQLERAEAELAAYSSGAAGTVTVASFATGIALVVAPAVARLAESAPGIHLRVQDAEGDASLPMVLDRQVDVAVAVEYRGAPPADDPRLAHVPLYAEPFDAVVPVTHRLSGAPQVPLAELAKDPWIGPYPGNPCHDVVVLACENSRLPAPHGALLGRLPRGRRPRLRRQPASPSYRARRCAAWTSRAWSSVPSTAPPPPGASSPPCAGEPRSIP